MKKSIFIIIILLLVKPVLPVLDYIVNYDYIASELCENKAKPQLQCNGKCHLMKELAKASEDEKPQSGKKNMHHETEVLFCEAIQDFTLMPVLAFSNNVTGTFYTNLYNHLDSNSVFHPPLFIS